MVNILNCPNIHCFHVIRVWWQHPRIVQWGLSSVSKTGLSSFRYESSFGSLPSTSTLFSSLSRNYFQEPIVCWPVGDEDFKLHPVCYFTCAFHLPAQSAAGLELGSNRLSGLWSRHRKTTVQEKLDFLRNIVSVGGKNYFFRVTSCRFSKPGK